MCQGEDAERVERARSVGNGREQPVDVFFVDALWEEGDNLEKPAGVRAEFSERWGGEGKLNRGDEAPRVLRVGYTYSLSIPFPGQSVRVPLVVLGGSGEQRDGQGMKIELLQDFVYRIGLFAKLVNPVESVPCGLG